MLVLACRAARPYVVCAAVEESHAGSTAPQAPPDVHKRRVRYSGKNPRTFEAKYKEQRGDAAVIAHVQAKGGTAAGTHRPIAVEELLGVLQVNPGDTVVDCTLGYGGHASVLLERVQPGGRLLCLDADGVTLVRTRTRLESLGHPAGSVECVHSNYAALASVLLEREPAGAHAILADLGVSSMQLDNPLRGLSYKTDGPLDMRLDTSRGKPASARLASWTSLELAQLLTDNADEPRAEALAAAICAAAARGPLETTEQLAQVVRRALPRGTPAEDVTATLRRVFQAIRIAVNGEFEKLDALLIALPMALRPGGRVAILTFHSGEDRRVKLSFKAGLACGLYSHISPIVIRPSWEEQRSNPRAACAKLRWAQRSAGAD